jgi:hypothetical protein
MTSQDALAFPEEANSPKQYKVASTSGLLVERDQEATLELGPECESDENLCLANKSFRGVDSQYHQVGNDLWIDKVLCVLPEH